MGFWKSISSLFSVPSGTLRGGVASLESIGDVAREMFRVSRFFCFAIGAACLKLAFCNDYVTKFPNNDAARLYECSNVLVDHCFLLL